MTLLPQIIFLIMTGFFGFLIFKRIQFIGKAIALGRKEELTGPVRERWKNMLLIAFGQKKMFKRPVPALLHLCVYLGFLLINLEILEIVLDGLLAQHRLFAPPLGSFYTGMISFFEILAVLVIIACIIFLVRRNVLGIDRFRKIEMKGWPKLDANLILVIEIVLMVAILTMNASDLVLQGRGVDHYTETGTFLISGLLMPIFEAVPTPGLVVLERVAWWLHIAGIFGFALYVTYSKHLHIFLAFPNTYYARLEPRGKMDNMEVVTNEVKSMLGLAGAPAEAPPADMRFGAKDVPDLSRKNVMDAFACTECGRCTAECPANLTGKKLSPRKIMMDTRDRAEELVSQGEGQGQKILLGGLITHEEINACTSCNACVEACPVLINPLDIILQMRRYMAMEESSSPQSWNMMFQNVETSLAPWKFAPSDRFKWADDLKKS